MATITNPSNQKTTLAGGIEYAQNLPVLYPGVPFAMAGTASDSDDPVAYQITLVRPDQPDTIIQNLTPAPVVAGFRQGAVQNASFPAPLPLGPIPNGLYYLKLTVRGGLVTVSDYVRVQVKQESLPGRLKFTEEDFVLPTAGIPLRVARTYDSANPFGTDFGPGWTYELLSVDGVVDDDRKPEQAIDSFAPDTSSVSFSKRIGGGRDVTLNIPGGTRSTFLFTPYAGPNNLSLYAAWTPPPGTRATLKMLNGNGQSDEHTAQIFVPSGDYIRWYIGQDVSYNNFDIPQYELQTEDGTKYELTRQSDGPLTTYVVYDQNATPPTSLIQPRSGRIQVTKITRLSGEVINIALDGTRIEYVPAGQTSFTRALTMRRDTQGRITAITAPGQANPVLKYEYNVDTGNLYRVYKLIDDAGSGAYVTNSTYLCGNANLPSYITSVQDARGIPVAQSAYYDGALNSADAPNNGRLKSITDAKLRTTTFTYATSGFEDTSGQAKSRVVVQDADGNQNVQELDQYGNVIFTKNPLNFRVSRTFGVGTGFGGAALDPNLLTKEQYETKLSPSDTLGTTLVREWEYKDSDYPFAPSTTIADYPQTYPPFDETKKRKTATVYNKRGQPESVYDPLSVAAGKAWYRSYHYDSFGQLTNETFTGSDSSNVEKPLVQNVYFPSGSQFKLLNYSFDANNTYTVYRYYDGVEAGGKVNDLKSVEVHDGSLAGSTLSKVTYEYDSFGNRTKQTVERSAGVSDSTSYTYDSQGRLIQQTEPVVVSGTGATSETQYNYIGKVASTTDRYGATTRYFYDSLGDQTCVRYADNTVTLTTTRYVGGERQVIVSDRHFRASNGQSTTGTRTIYDKAGRPKRVEKLNSVSIIESSGVVATSIDANLLCDTTLNPTVVNNVETTPVVLTATATTYYEDGRVASTTDGNGNMTMYQYSADGLTRTVRPPDYLDPDNNNYVTEILEGSDLNGNVVTTQTRSFKNGNAVAETQRPRMRSVYDQLNRMRESWVHNDENDAVGVKLSATDYDWLGRKTLETVWESASESTQKKFDYDGLGRLTRVTSGFGTADHTITKYAYDEAGNLMTQWDGNQFDGNDALVAGAKSTTFQYDALGRRTRRTLPMGGTFEQWDYDFNEATGASSTLAKRPNAVRHKDFNGGYLTMVNDTMGRLDLKKQGSTVLVDIDYTATGLRSQMKDNLNNQYTSARTTKYFYDDLQRLMVKNMPEGTLTYNYDNAGNLKMISAWRVYSNIPSAPPYIYGNLIGSDTRTAGAFMFYKLDSRGRVARVNEDGQSVNAEATYSYDPVGNLAKLRYANTIQSTYTYNARNQLTLLTTGPNGGSGTASFKYDDSAWSAARRLGYTGQRRKLDETINGVLRSYEYDYDGLRRLKKENVLSGANSGAITYDGANGYGDVGYDKVGNRGKRDSTVSGVAQRVYAPYDGNDWPGNGAPVNGQVSLRFDSNGNTSQFNLDADTAWDQAAYDTYDQENRLVIAIRGAVTQFAYDGDGKRIMKKVGSTPTFFLVDDLNPTGYAQVLEEQIGTPGGTPSVTYLYGLDLILQKRSNVNSYYGYDGLGSTRYLTASSGTVTDTYTYDAFGLKLSNSTGTTPNSYFFTGEQFDSETGMYYLRAPRYYHPEIGRFWTRDPYDGDPEAPMSLHGYAYTGNDPVNNIDPTGEFTDAISFNTAAAIGLGLVGLTATAQIEAKTHGISQLLASAGTGAGEILDEATAAGQTAVLEAEAAILASYRSLSDAVSQAKDTLKLAGRLVRNVKVVPMPRSVIPAVAAHVATAQASGYPSVLVRATPAVARANRRAALAGRIAAGFGQSWDEYPFASGRPPGVAPSVAAVPILQNSIQGGIISACYRLEKITPGVPYIVVVTP